MSATKVLGDKNLHLVRGKELSSKNDKENTEFVINRRSSAVKSRSQSLAREELTTSLSSPFAVFEEKPEVCDAAVQVSEATTSSASTDEEKIALHTDFVTAEEPPAEYWKLVAETRRTALAEALEENEQLHEKVKEKDEEVSDLKKEREALKARITAMQQEIFQLRDIMAEAKKVSEMFQELSSQWQEEEEDEGEDGVEQEGDE